MRILRYARRHGVLGEYLCKQCKLISGRGRSAKESTYLQYTITRNAAFSTSSQCRLKEESDVTKELGSKGLNNGLNDGLDDELNSKSFLNYEEISLEDSDAVSEAVSDIASTILSSIPPDQRQSFLIRLIYGAKFRNLKIIDQVMKRDPSLCLSNKHICDLFRLALAYDRQNRKESSQLKVYDWIKSLEPVTSKRSRLQLFDEIIPWIANSQIPSATALHWSNQFIFDGYYPSTVESSHVFEALLQNIGESSPGLLHSSWASPRFYMKFGRYLRNNQTTLQTKLLVTALAHLSSKLPKQQSLEPIQRLIQLAKMSKRVDRILTAEFWSYVISKFAFVDIDTLTQLMSSHDANLYHYPAVLEQLLLRQKTLHRANAIVRLMQQSGVEPSVTANGHILRLLCHKSSKDAKTVYNGIRNATTDPKIFSQLLLSYMYGCVESRNFQGAVSAFKDLDQSKLVRQSGSNNLLQVCYDLNTSALSRSNSLKDAVASMRQMWIQGLKVSSKTYNQLLLKIILKLHQDIKHKAVLLSISHRPEWTVSSLIYILFEANKRGLKPTQLCYSHILHLIELRNTRFQEVKSLVLAVATLLQNESNNRSSQINRPFNNDKWLKDIEPDQTVSQKPSQPPRQQNIFSRKFVKKIVYSGFVKSPSRPWNGVLLLHKLRERGFVISQKAALESLASVTSWVYGYRDAKDEILRVRSQVNKRFTLAQLVECFNLAWNGQFNLEMQVETRLQRKARKKNEAIALSSHTSSTPSLAFDSSSSDNRRISSSDPRKL